MSIESEILRIQRNVADTYSVVADRGGNVPNIPTVARLAEAVGSIPVNVLTAGDGNPIGTVISFMGTSAPDDYLVCDGAVHNVSEYPELAAFFSEQFGVSNYFGGDGKTTFAVPDMRNLFLRGYHGNAEEQLSGEIGKKQEATKIPGISSSSTSAAVGIDKSGGSTYTSFTDSIENGGWISVSGNLSGTGSLASYTKLFTSRPVNMAVLYCIKAVESIPIEAVEYTKTTD